MGTGGMKNLVVVGNGMAANAFVEEALKACPGAFRITVFGKEAHPSYNRVLISQVLTGEKGASDLAMHAPEWYAERAVEVRSRSKVVRIDRARRVVVTECGAEAPYDKLVLATGSAPIMPDVEGVGLAGVVALRSLDDCERIKALASAGAKAAVVGGGILGLEAADALRALGMDVTVVHLVGRLMERQLDERSASFLRDALEAKGVKTLLGRQVVAFEGGGRLERLRLKDGSALEASVAVVSIGIRPNKELAESAGLYCERGVVVSDTMQTYDPSVYAIGECVQHRGSTFGLVAPIFEQARVAANQLAGDGRRSFKASPTSARLKVPDIDLYAAGDLGASDDTIEYMDRKAGVYKMVALDNGRVRGVVLFGDSSRGPELFGLLSSGEDVSHRRGELLAPGGAGQAAAVLPDDATVCGCKGITKAMIVAAVKSKGLFTREEVKKETGASSSCGGCAQVVDRILEETLGADFQAAASQAICGCTGYSRDDVLKNIREKRLVSVSAVMETLGWEGVGCEECRPALNYYVSMVWPSEASDDLTSRLINERAHANIQKDGTFSVVPRIYGGVTTPQELRKIAEVAERHSVPLVKITGGQRIALMGIDRAELHGVWDKLGMPSGHAYAKAVRTVKTCVGDRFCRYGTQDSISLGVELEKRLAGLPMPAKVKLAVSGCPRNCAESGIKDIGVVGVASGWEIWAGGCGGIELKAALRYASLKTAEEVMEAAAAFLQLYREEAHYGERTYRWVARRGLESIRREALDDAPSRQALASRLMAASKAAMRDPWHEAGQGLMRKGA